MPTGNLLPSGEVFHWELWLYFFNPFIHSLIPKIFIEYWQVPLPQLEGGASPKEKRVCLGKLKLYYRRTKPNNKKQLIIFF